MTENDDWPRDFRTFAARAGAGFVTGVAFYSRFSPRAWGYRRPSLDNIALALPLTSLAIGAAPAALLVALTMGGLPPLFAAGLAVGLLLVLTGAMAEDALADAADGLFGGGSPARRLEIMRDTHHGTYGVLALVLMILLRVVAIGALSPGNPAGAAGGWLAAMIAARSGSMWLATALPPARTDGLSASVGRVTRPAFAIGAGLAAVLLAIFGFAVAGIAGLVATAVLLVAVTAVWTWLCRRLVGGQTGDLIGALQALLEIAALAGLLAFA